MSRRWRVELGGRVVATYADVEKARKRAQELANKTGREVELSYRPAGYQWPYRIKVKPDKVGVEG